jgi:DNA-binding MarR family transcriptional regulator
MASSRLTDTEIRAWQALLHAHHDIVEALDAELQRDHDLTLSEYDVLLRLARAPGRSLRMSELAGRVLMSPSGATRLVDRLVARHLADRRDDPEDGRVALASLTDAGLGLVRRAARTHLRGIRDRFTGRLTEPQLVDVAEALEIITGPHVPH